MKNIKAVSRWMQLKDKFGHRRATAITYLLIVGLVSLFIHILFVGGLGQSSLLYMLVPYGISMLIALMRSDSIADTNFKRYIRHLSTTIVVFLAASIVLREGFVCVIFFFPIYFFMVTVAYVIYEFGQRLSEKKTKLHSVGVPILVLALSLEGTSSLLSFDRNLSIKVSRVSSLSVDEIKENLATPLNLEKSRHWMLSIFPMPTHIEAGSLKEGDIHKINTRYHRWFITNTHEGSAELLIQHVSENSIRTKLLNDTTYFSSYLQLHGTIIELKPLQGGKTEISLQIDFERKLDPAWYFHPMQKFGVSQMAHFLIEEVMIRNTANVGI